MKGKPMKKDSSKAFTRAQAAELKGLSALPDDKINIQKVPEQRDWAGSQRGVFYRPIKKQLTLRVDADVIDWFKSHASKGEGYQTSINSALREYVAKHEQNK